MTLRDQVQSIMSDGRWWTPFEMQGAVLFRFHRHCSDGGLTAKVRDLRKEKYGSHLVKSRRRAGCSEQVWEYRLVLPATVGDDIIDDAHVAIPEQREKLQSAWDEMQERLDVMEAQEAG